MNFIILILLKLFFFVYRLNLCRKNAKETTELCHKIKELYATYLHKPPPEFFDIITYSLDALWYVDITAEKESFMSFTYKLHNLPCKYSIFVLIINIFLF